MSLLDRFFEASHPDMPSSWNVLETPDQVSQLLDLSNRLPVVVFKHSVRCGSSSMALWQLKEGWTFGDEEFDFWYLDVIRRREVSDRIAQEFGVIHHSPQLILVHGRQAKFHTSHHGVRPEVLKQWLESL